MKNEAKETPKTIYIFFREDVFYPIELENDKEAIEGAELNKGTLRVEDLNGRIVWQLNK